MPLIPDDTLESIHRLNRAYLHAARDGLRAGQERLIEGIFGLDTALRNWLLSASPETIEQLAVMPGLVFQARFPSDVEPLLSACTEKPLRDVAELHLLLHQLGDGEQPELAGSR
jgi:hypothetical protein